MAYPRQSPFTERAAPCPPPLPDYERDIGAHCRLRPVPRKPLNFQRVLVLKAAKGDSLFVAGSAGQAAYNGELKRSKMTASPFRRGELCLRDFEAARAGSMLLKPDMPHIETWPDIFVPGESCAFFSRDCDNLKERRIITRSERISAKGLPGTHNGHALPRLKEWRSAFSSIIKEIES